MNIYEENSDSFSKEYLDYLGTLTTEQFAGTGRVTKNADGEIVRIEFWIDNGEGVGIYQHLDFQMSGWMKS